MNTTEYWIDLTPYHVFLGVGFAVAYVCGLLWAAINTPSGSDDSDSPP